MRPSRSPMRRGGGGAHEGRPRRAVALGALLLAGCAGYDRLNRPFPDIHAATLEGRVLDRESLRGRPWLIQLWLPG